MRDVFSISSFFFLFQNIRKVRNIGTTKQKRLGTYGASAVPLGCSGLCSLGKLLPWEQVPLILIDPGTELGTALGNEDVLGAIERDAHLAFPALPSQTGKNGSNVVAVSTAQISALLTEAFTPYLHVGH